MLLSRLISAYKKQHELYVETRHQFGLWSSLSSLSVILLFIMVGVAYLFYGESFSYRVFHSESADYIGFAGLFMLVVYMLVDLRRKVAKARKELDRLKEEAESIGLQIACNQQDEFDPKVEIVNEGTNTANYVLIPKSQKIDFKEYNRLFRL